MSKAKIPGVAPPEKKPEIRRDPESPGDELKPEIPGDRPPPDKPDIDRDG